MYIIAYIENIIWALIFFAILYFFDGWGKAWAIVPIFCLNTFKRSKQ